MVSRVKYCWQTVIFAYFAHTTGLFFFYQKALLILTYNLIHIAFHTTYEVQCIARFFLHGIPGRPMSMVFSVVEK